MSRAGDRETGGAVFQIASGLINGFLDLIYPRCCLFCNTPSSVEICIDCRSKLIPVSENSCSKCGGYIDYEACPMCLAFEFNFDRALSFYVYEEPLKDAILDFKYHRAAEKGILLASILADAFMESEMSRKKFDIIVPVPLSDMKKRERTYNQTEILAQELGQRTGILYAPFALIKNRETRSQTGLDPAERRDNVEGAYNVPDMSIIKGKVVLLLDDIITTGATVSECAKLLRNAGARRVVAVSLGRGGKYR